MQAMLGINRNRYNNIGISIADTSCCNKRIIMCVSGHSNIELCAYRISYNSRLCKIRYNAIVRNCSSSQRERNGDTSKRVEFSNPFAFCSKCSLSKNKGKRHFQIFLPVHFTYDVSKLSSIM